MRASRLWTVLLPLAVLACGGGDEGIETDTAEDAAGTITADSVPGDAPATVDTSMPGGAQEMGTVTLQPVGGSAITGEASLSDQAGQTVVVLNLRGATPGGTHQAHIHNGTCQALGQVVAPLQPVAVDSTGFGTSTTSVAQALGTLTGGSFVISAHEAGGSPGAPVSCGTITAHAM